MVMAEVFSTISMEIHEIYAVAVTGNSSNRDGHDCTRQLRAATPGGREAPQGELATCRLPPAEYKLPVAVEPGAQILNERG